MIFYFFLNLLNFSFFKVSYKYKFSESAFASFFLILLNLFIFSLILFLFFIVCNKLIKFFKIIEKFLNLIIFNLFNWFLNHFFSLFLDFLFFIHRIRFMFFSGTSYYDPLTKVFLDKLSILKGELLMDFYNFSNKFIFENNFNIPLSIFSQTSIFEPSRNFHLVKIYFNFQNELMQSHNKSRSVFYFLFKKNVSKNFFNRKTNSYFFELFSVSHSFLVSLNKFFLLILVFLFNFCSIDFFVFLNRVNINLINNNHFFFFKLFFIKYFTCLRSMFLFLLINLEHDSFLNYLYITLYRLALKNFYTKSDWNNMFNTYNLNFTESFPFHGFNKDDFFSIFKITLFYFFIYLNYLIFFFFSAFGVLIKFFFFFICYLSNFFNIYLNFYSFYINFFNIFSFFYFSFFVKIFVFMRDLLFPSFLKRAFSLINSFFLILENFEYFFYLSFLWYTFCINIFFYLQLFFSIFLFLINNIFYYIYLIVNNIFSFKFLKYFYSSFFLSDKIFFYNLITLLNYLKFNSFFLVENLNFYLNQHVLLFEFSKLNFYYYYYFPDQKFSNFYFKLSKFFRFISFFRFLRLPFFSFVLLFNLPLNVLLNSKTHLHGRDFLNISNKSIFFLDYFFDLFVFYIFYPFFFLLNNLDNFPFKKIFYLFISLVFEFVFFFKLSFWLFSSYLYYFIYFFQFFLFMFFFTIVCYYFSFFIFIIFVISLLILVSFFIFYFLFRFYSIIYSHFVFNKYFTFFLLFFRVNILYYYYYLSLIYFLRVRNFGFLEILGIFFLIRNDLKKYDFLHASLVHSNFSSLNTDLLVNNFLNQFMKKKNNIHFSNDFSSVSFFNFLKFKNVFSKNYNSLNKFKHNNLRNKFLRVQIRNDLFPEFEYHKYLRSRNSRNLNVFRLRKALDPHDLYLDSALDKFENFQSNSTSNNFFNFDFLKVFYNDDSMFIKEFLFFRNIFSRKNLSFFYDDLDSLSNFRISYNKLPPLFRYFYLKREKMKYIFSMYTFGNINYFAFSILFNWLLTYRILRATKNLFFSFNNSFLIFKNRVFPKFSLIILSIILDQIILIFNLFLDVFIYFFLFFVLYFWFFPFSWFLFIFIFVKFLFLFKIISKLNFYVQYTEKRPQFFGGMSIFLSFLNPFCFINFYKAIFKKFTFSFRYIFSISIYLFSFIIFLFYLFYFDLNNFLNFIFFQHILLYELNESFLVFYFLNSTQNNLSVVIFIYLNNLYVYLFVIILFSFIFRSFFFSNIATKIFSFDNYFLIRFVLFLLKIDTKFKLFYFFSLFSKNKISPYILMVELDFLIRLQKIENEFIKTTFYRKR